MSENSTDRRFVKTGLDAGGGELEITLLLLLLLKFSLFGELLLKLATNEGGLMAGWLGLMKERLLRVDADDQAKDRRGNSWERGRERARGGAGLRKRERVK